MTHNFAESLAWSQSWADAPWWEDVYRQAFPAFETMICQRQDGWAQRAGIDRHVFLSDGTTVKVDEKVREQDWPDFFLEYWSDWERQKAGWVASNLACDYIAYAFVPTQTCYLLPFQPLRRAWRQHCRDWVAEYGRREVANDGWTTVGTPVPIDVVLDAIRDALIVKWGSA